MSESLVAVLIVVAVIVVIAGDATGVAPQPATLRAAFRRVTGAARSAAGAVTRDRARGEGAEPPRHRAGSRSPAGAEQATVGPPLPESRPGRGGQPAPLEPIAIPLWTRLRAAGGLGLMVALLGLTIAGALAAAAVVLGSVLDQALR